MRTRAGLGNGSIAAG